MEDRGVMLGKKFLEKSAASEEIGVGQEDPETP